MSTDQMIERELTVAHLPRPLTATQARTDRVVIAGYPEAIDRQIADDARRLAKRWGWRVGKVQAFIAPRVT